MRHRLECKPDTVVWGFLSPDVPEVLRIESGDTVLIDTVNPVGMPQERPQDWLKAHGVEATGSVVDTLEILRTVEKGEGPHVLTGPIRVHGLRAGEVLAIDVLSVNPRPPFYGVNYSRPGAGSLPSLLGEPWCRVIALDVERQEAAFSSRLRLPLAPFMGTMGVAPLTRTSSIPPGPHGGNMDLKDLRPGATLYLPAQVDGGLFFVGDGHAMQGNGEVNLTALETSMQCELRFTRHENCRLQGPLAETGRDYLVMGLDADLNLAAEQAVRRSVRVLQWAAGVSEPEAYALCSLVVDLEVTQIVDGVKGIHARIPKHLVRPEADGQRWGPPPTLV